MATRLTKLWDKNPNQVWSKKICLNFFSHFRLTTITKTSTKIDHRQNSLEEIVWKGEFLEKNRINVPKKNMWKKFHLLSRKKTFDVHWKLCWLWINVFLCVINYYQMILTIILICCGNNSSILYEADEWIFSDH